MKTYRCHKVVQAAKITAVELSDMGEGPTYLHLENGERAQLPYPKFDPKVGGYYVVYEDGYASYSPAEAFEAGYTEVVNAVMTWDADGKPTLTDI
jgi:hypothetical protein